MKILVFTNDGNHLDFNNVENLNFTGRVLTFTYLGKRTGSTSQANFVNVAGWVEMGNK